MSRICEIPTCNKKPLMGNRIARRGIAKKSGGIGLKTTGISTRRFLPNLQNIRVIENGTVKTMTVCTKCIKAGKIQKPPRRNYKPETPAVK
ncbi:MAG: large subunit ribosomal protein L28 [Candidatus Omnitrophota bacterium]|jgi:large subunit ribosomal protein L28